MKKVVPDGGRIKDLRINSERVSTQKELAHEIRVSERKLREIENKDAAVGIDVLDRLAKCFGVHREQLAKSAGPTAAASASTVTVPPRAPDVFQDILADLGKDRIVPRHDYELAYATTDEGVLFKEANRSHDVACSIDIALSNETSGYAQELFEILRSLTWEVRDCRFDIPATEEIAVRRRIKMLLVLLKGNDIGLTKLRSSGACLNATSHCLRASIRTCDHGWSSRLAPLENMVRNRLKFRSIMVSRSSFQPGRSVRRCAMATPEPAAASGETLTEKQAFAELLAWAAGRPAWQRDALRRLVLNGKLGEQDVEALVELCLDPSLPCEPLSEKHVSAQGLIGEQISLLRIEDPIGINALASDQTLTFGKEGLSIVYGDNGSGKSGYVRVLKHACRSRDRNSGKILRDVESAAATAQSANIVFARGCVVDKHPWTPEAQSHADLPYVSIFDSRSANVHVEKTNAVAYIPQPMKMLEALAVACDQIGAKLTQQQSAIAAQTPLTIESPQLGAQTAAGAFVHGLSARSNVAQLELLASLSDEEQQRLATLDTDLAQDPRRAAAKIANQKARFDELCAKLAKMAQASSGAAFAARDALKTDWDAKADAACLASEALFAAAPLPDVGKDTWTALWEAARRFSDTVAYPNKTFPDAGGTDEICVLCQQPLTPEAINRRVTFETFVKGSTKVDEDAAAKAHGDAIRSADAQRMSVGAVRQLASLVATEIGNEPVAGRIRACGVRAGWRLRALKRQQAVPGEGATYPAGELEALSADLARRVAFLSSDQNSPEHVALVKERAELKDREALAPLVDDIKAEIERRKQVEAITKAAKDTAKRSVTTKNKELSDKLVTNALRGRFAREIEKLKLARMPVELRKVKDANAVSYFQVCLVERPNEPVGEIFSEGEHRCVALAAFLAELFISKQYSGIVFDDPMSSLDHIHRKAVAARLIEEAKHRQVIVFTHDLTFLFELRREAEAKGRPVHYQTVCRKQSRPGHVEGELPMKAKSAQQLAHSLRSELKEAKQQFDSWADAKRTILSKGVIEQLREAWDQGIADFIFPVLGRFDNSVKGTSLFKLAVMDEEDVRTVTAARSRLSEELHTSSETLNPETVSHADLLAEVVKLENWLVSVAQRQREAKVPITSYT